MLGIGSFVAGWVSYGTYIGLTDTAQWRLPLGLQMLPAVGLAALIFLFPESPRYVCRSILLTTIADAFILVG